MSSRMRKVVTCTALVALLPALFPLNAAAWGARGHRIVTRIAEERLTPAAAAAVRDLLNNGDTLVDIASWADHEGHNAVPESAPWHYVNVPIREHEYDPRFCASGGCVVSKIKDFRTILADRTAPRRDRQRALLFLVHFVEDVHQPLHVGDNNDRGGNRTQLQYHGQGTNLHRLWDSGLIDHANLSERAWVARVKQEIDDRKAADWQRGTVEDWATESLIAAQKAYFFPKGARRPIASGTRVGKDYEEMALPIVRERLAQAGVRLAAELNAIFH